MSVQKLPTNSIEIASAQHIERMQRLVDMALAKGATAAEASCHHGNSRELCIREQQLEGIAGSEDFRLSLDVYIGQQNAQVTSSQFYSDQDEALIDKALFIAKNMQPDPFAGLPNSSLLVKEPKDMQQYFSADINQHDIIDRLLASEQHALNQYPAIKHCLSYSFTEEAGEFSIVNSDGLSYAAKSKDYGYSVGFVAEQKGDMQRHSDSVCSLHFEQLPDPEQLAKEVASETCRRLQARKIKSQTCPVIFHRDVSASLISHILAAIRGNSVYQKTSFLLDKIGDHILPDFVSVLQRPHQCQTFGAAVCDREGVVTRDLDIVSNGILTTYILGSYSARQLSLQSTGNAGGIYNVQVPGQVAGLSELLQQMQTGLLVTELMGDGVNLVTGDYSRGASGFWVENGAIAYPVHDFTIGGHLPTMYQAIEAIANDYKSWRNLKVGSILLNEITVGGA